VEPGVCVAQVGVDPGVLPDVAVLAVDPFETGGGPTVFLSFMQPIRPDESITPAPITAIRLRHPCAMVIPSPEYGGAPQARRLLVTGIRAGRQGLIGSRGR